MPINLQNIREKVEVEAEIDGTLIETETGDRPDVEIEINKVKVASRVCALFAGQADLLGEVLGDRIPAAGVNHE